MNTDSSGLSNNAKHVMPNFKQLKYFGDCKNTVDIDKMWDATQMAGVLNQSSIIKMSDLIQAKIIFENGDRKIPQKLKNWFKLNDNKLNDENQIVCGINERQKIFFIYITDLDTHFFFDAK